MNTRSSGSDLGVVFAILGILFLVCSVSEILVYISVLPYGLQMFLESKALFLVIAILVSIGCGLSFTASYGFKHHKHWSITLALLDVLTIVILGLLLTMQLNFSGLIVLSVAYSTARLVLNYGPVQRVKTES
ncbi:MAG: hypothetical protein ACJAYE_001606 [Candidatus Azotimanducaceae bacterium]|jgi:hypothetical protein